MLEVNRINAGYGQIPVLQNLTIKVEKGQIAVVIGSNGAGKTTLLKTISGLLHPESGEINFLGKRIDKLPPHEIVKAGISHIPEGRRLFGKLTVLQNLELGAYTRISKTEMEETLDYVYQLFPILEERENQKAETLSGGERQMLAIGRGLMSKPKLLMLDEPSIGLMPILIPKLMGNIKQINKQGTTILLVEQKVQRALGIADKAYLIKTGRIVLEGSGKKIFETEEVRKGYMGI